MNPDAKNQQGIKVTQEFHAATKNWISSLQFIEDELRFIENLMCSYVFEPDTPNLFERLQDYKERVQKIGIRMKEIAEALLDHENELSGLLESRKEGIDDGYASRHGEFQAAYLLFQQDFQWLKSEIFNYAGGILRKRRPDC
ncbi:hypothetical protein [Lentiprolixibacter aurantiacus]|uniref:Uncharacterized protein n=1 Tax=Lentiprolixibacter aurantiacus TaxID=2993939 RepID=A0AAE3MLW4_9FLAO|nr:hypothetical protein [Lentiprolixibacter aurantiacus]MCX2720101.1 hypothetical protein [Lentiprolixibacter aurantiacus]